MLKIAIIVWIMLGTVLAGSAVTAVLTAGLAPEPTRLVPLAALAGVIVAMPLSYFVARRIARNVA